ncbi:unnamed protein product [Effrenium voratum]|nr:unnamed protein product [Effrenium voratum]
MRRARSPTRRPARSDEPVDELEDVSPELQRSKSQASIPSVPTDDQDMEFSLTKANGKVPEGMIQKMLELVQASRKAPQADDARRSGASLVAASAAATLANFAQDTDIERFIGSLGGLEIMLDSMEVATEDFHLQATRFLWNMTFSKANQQRFIDHGGIAKLVDSMKRFQQPHHGPLQEQGCGVIRNLACGHSGRHKRALLKSGTIRALCKALKLFHQEANVCVQAMAALTELCLGAPPAAHQARTLGALRWLLTASLKLAGTNAQVTEQVLEALEAILLIPQALAAFGQHGGHLEVLKVLDRFSSDTTVLLAFRTLAAALSHTKLKEMVDGDSTEDLAYLITSSAERETQLEYWKQMGKSPGSLIRQDLLDAGLIQKVIDALQQFDQYTIAIEAGAGVLMNLTLEVQEVDQDEKHLQRKLDVGMACHGCLEIIGHLSGQRNTAGFASNMFRLLAAVSLHEEIALLLHRKQAAKTALEYLQAYEEEPVVQAAGCAFLGNLANAKLHIREGIVEVGVLDFLIALLVRKRSVALVVQSACKALKELSPAEAALGILKRFPIVDNVFQAADPHLAEAHLGETDQSELLGMGALIAAALHIHGNLVASGCESSDAVMMLSAIDTNYAEELNKKQTTTRVLQVLRTHRAHHEVCRCCGGLLRNLFSAPLSAQASEECLAAEGLRLLLDALWTHCVPPVEGTMSRANYVLANRGSMDSVDEGPQRAGSTLAQGNGGVRRGSVEGLQGARCAAPPCGETPYATA